MSRQVELCCGKKKVIVLEVSHPKNMVRAVEKQKSTKDIFMKGPDNRKRNEVALEEQGLDLYDKANRMEVDLFNLVDII